MNQQQLEKRITHAAENILQTQHYVRWVDVLLEIGWLQPVHLTHWQKGNIPYLEQIIQTNLSKLNDTMTCFQQWATKKCLKPSETQYWVRTRGAKRSLQFSKSGQPRLEKAYRTHYVSPELSEKKQQLLKEKLEKPPEHVVFCIIKNTNCDVCHQEISKGEFLYEEQDKALCMRCSGFEKLVFLLSGNAKRTRRVKQYSQQYAVVVRFSRSRKRYERQGLLVEESALQRADIE